MSTAQACVYWTSHQERASLSCSAFPTEKQSYQLRIVPRLLLLLGFAACCAGGLPASATVTAVFVEAPSLAEASTVTVTSPVHFQATAESDLNITGYVIYVDNQSVFQNFISFLDTWVMLGPGSHLVYVKAWDSSGSLASTATYSLNVTGFAPPTPPASAVRLMHLARRTSEWTVNNNSEVGGTCQDGSIMPFKSDSDPNTKNSPDAPWGGLHLLLTSKCQYDDSLFYFKDTQNPSPFAGSTNVLWDFWFYLPTTTPAGSIQALEFDFFQAVQLSDGVHEFMFGSQCNYSTNQWQLWLPQNGTLTWVNAGLSPCQFAIGAWHHATYFLQRVTAGGYQQIPGAFNSESDTNSSLRFGTLTIDGTTMYLGALSNSTIPNPQWSPVLGVQHQLDSAMSGVTIDEFVDAESVIAW